MVKNSKRSANFTSSEVAILVELAKKHFSVIENKKSDAQTWREKKLTWETIACEFNTQSTITRDATILKKKWDNVKKHVKEKVAGQWHYGGGPAAISPNLSQEEDEILSLIKPRPLGQASVFDCEVIYETPDNMKMSPQSSPEPGTMASGADAATRDLQDKSDWAVYAPLNLQNRMSSVPQDKGNVADDECSQPIWVTQNAPELENGVSPSTKNKSRKRPLPGSSSNNVWCQLEEKQKNLDALKEKKLKEDLEIQAIFKSNLLLHQREMELKIKLLEMEVERNSNL